MISSRIQIENGAIVDLFNHYGFIYLFGSRRFAPPEKKCDSSSYAEKEGVNIDPRTVDDEFDYTVRVLIQTPNRHLVNANSKIRAFNADIRRTSPGSDVKHCKEITFYDDYKRCKIVGFPSVIEEVDESNYYRRQNGSVPDCINAEFTIHVTRPSRCMFDTFEGIGYMTIAKDFRVGGVSAQNTISETTNN